MRSALKRLHRVAAPDGLEMNSLSRIYRDAVHNTAEKAPAVSSSMSRAPPRRWSGLQLEILGYYKKFLKTIREKAAGDTATQLAAMKYVRLQFDSNKSIPRQNIAAIEWHVRRAEVKLEELQSMKRLSGFQIVK